MPEKTGDETVSRSDDDHLALTRSPTLLLLSNSPKGRGVISSQPIKAGTVVETCPVLILDAQENKEHIAKTSLYHYTYNWPILNADGTKAGQTQAVIFGLGSMFNHSTRHQNIGWTRDLDRQVVVYRALRDIPPGEELCISYGDRLTFVDADAGLSESEEETDDVLLKSIETI
ncbi:hypothetical protein AMS68_003756 [Peltaster fructicola]|uniref:SET domain-containing protein n=1 Tax=Peltaster fructicola TaxID=286661 RepID=A0A6H0XUE1_9PEZI|nr:hypothetical protein AMS68_003756 [Peltaster fructicola]